MRLEHLRVQNFRNIREAELDFDGQFVVFMGQNGQGKTNLIEAIHTLLLLRGFRVRSHRELIKWGEQTAGLGGRLRDSAGSRWFRAEIAEAGIRASIDGKGQPSLAHYSEQARLVLFSPEDLVIVHGQPSERRRFLDRAAFTLQPSFVEVARSYQRILDQRAALLKQSRVDVKQLDALNQQMAVMGARLSVRRQRVVEELRSPFEALQQRIAGIDSATLVYDASLGQGDEPTQTAVFLKQIADVRTDELRRRMNLVGPQRDDLTVLIDGKDARSFGSQGQVRSVVLALKLAELERVRARGVGAIFLLDDLSSELDQQRTQRLTLLVQELAVQCFISTTDPGPVLEGLPERALRLFRAEAGEISLQPTSW